MKKKLVKLILNKQKISNFEQGSITGGVSGRRLCGPTAPFNADCITKDKINCKSFEHTGCGGGGVIDTPSIRIVCSTGC